MLPDNSLYANDLRTSQPVARIPLWISIIVILGALLTLAGAIISKVDPIGAWSLFGEPLWHLSAWRGHR